jgi:hypothetical protein
MTTTNNKYNGWTNYATWRINLEMFDGVAFLEDHTDDTYDYSKRLEESANEYLEQTASEGLALDYARAFISDVNWYEIAEHMQEAYNEENQE